MVNEEWDKMSLNEVSRIYKVDGQEGILQRY